MAHAVPLDGKEVSEVQRIGGGVFDAIFSEGKKFELEIAAGRLELERLMVEKARLEADLEPIKATAEQEPPVPQFPKLFSVRWWTFATCLVLFLVSCGAAIANISAAYLPSIQSHLLAIAVASPWVLAAVAAKLLTRGAQARTLTIVRWSVATTGLLGLVLWLAGGTTILPDRRLAFIGQLLAEFCAGFLLITGMVEALTYQRVIVKNENRTRIANCVAEVVRQIDLIMQQLQKPTCNLAEWQASRASFIEEGLTILRIRAAESAYLAELQHQRADNQRLLAAFNS
jgi:flagellar biosynthesis protein FliQ